MGIEPTSEVWEKARAPSPPSKTGNDTAYRSGVSPDTSRTTTIANRKPSLVVNPALASPVRR
jgi:hypothetical protein